MYNWSGGLFKLYYKRGIGIKITRKLKQRQGQASYSTGYQSKDKALIETHPLFHILLSRKKELMFSS